jgi:hypothetical protein
MKMTEAQAIIDGKNNEGFMVHFEWKKGGMLYSDYFPDNHAGESLIKTEKEAWRLAVEFAKKMRGEVVNLYVVKSDYMPVAGYQAKCIENREVGDGSLANPLPEGQGAGQW